MLYASDMEQEYGTLRIGVSFGSRLRNLCEEDQESFVLRFILVLVFLKKGINVQ